MSPAALLIGREFITNVGHQALTGAVERMWNGGAPSKRLLYSIAINRKRDLTLMRIVHNTNNDDDNNNNNNNNDDRQQRFAKHHLATDEGFESDIDSVSLLSSDGDSLNCVDRKKRDAQTSDSANSSSASDSSDTETGDKNAATLKVEHYSVDSVICYTNVRFPKVIAFVVKKDAANGRNEIIAFEFQSSEHYDRIRYAFNTPTNTTNGSLKFNLLHRTDKNGVTHIEISNSSESGSAKIKYSDASNTIGDCLLRTPRAHEPTSRADKLFSKMTTNLSKMRSNSHADLLNENTRLQQHNNTEIVPKQSEATLKSRSNSYADLSNKEIIDCIIIRSDVDDDATNKSDCDKHRVINNRSLCEGDSALRKVWRSADDILDADTMEPPKKPERRKKAKGKAPPPPNVMKGQYVRVAVDPNSSKRIEQPTLPTSSPSSNIGLATFESNKMQNYYNSNWVYVSSQPTAFKNSTSEFRTEFVDHHRAYTINRMSREPTRIGICAKWTSSVQRVPKTPRSRSDSRYPKQNNNPYRFVDTTVPQVAIIYPPAAKSYATAPPPPNMTNPSSISNRLFGLSQKLKEFGTNVVVNNTNRFESDALKRRSSLGEMTYKTSINNRCTGMVDSVSSNLKSVIKKRQSDDRKMKNNNEKKVTFSAFATVQVV